MEVEGDRFERHGPIYLLLELGHLIIRSGRQGESLGGVVGSNRFGCTDH